jgi:asparagine synthase (glutamine-hydrolysing)
MCGIAGTTRNISERDVATVASGMSHRGPDGYGTFISPDVTFIHRRLSIIDLDQRSMQPMWTPEKDIALIYNGEIYNYQILRKELEKDYKFITTSDTEVILHGYRKYGNDIWHKLSGMFAATIVDFRHRKIILSRDHAGIKPLFYHFDGECITWASEIKSLFQMLPGLNPLAQLVPERMEAYFVLGYIPSPTTLYKDIFQVEKSSFIEFDLDSRTILKKSFETVSEEKDSSLKEIVSESVLAHLASDVPVGLFFSGGVDSSLIAAVLQEHKKDLRAYSLVMPGRGADYEYGKKIADHLKMHVEYAEFDTAAFEESYRHVTRSITLPLADIALFPTWYISKQAAKEVKVVLSGEGGDELFFGYPRHSVLRRKPTMPFLSNLLDIYREQGVHPGKGLVYQKLSSHIDLAAYYISICSPAFGAVEQRSFDAVRTSIKEKSADPLFFDRDFYLENMLLQKLDLMGMQHSLEGRVPLLAPSLFAYSRTEASRFSESDGSIQKPALKKVLEEYIPKELIYRKKSGFGFNAAQFVKHSTQVHKDFDAAYEFLCEYNIVLTTRYEKQWLIENKSGVVLAAILLHRSIINTI